MNTVFVVNPHAGGKKARKEFLKWYSLVKGQVDVVISRYKSFLLQHYRYLCRYKYLYVFGGDGTINEVVNAIYKCKRKKDVFITIVPSGTGNDFVKSLPIGRFIKFYPGILRWNGNVRYFVNTVGTGIDAYTSYYSNEVKGKYLRGMAAYTYGLVKTMMLKNYQVEIEDANIPLPSDISILSFGRGSYIGGGFLLLPHASIFSREISWLAAAPLGALELILHLHMLFNGNITKYYKVYHGTQEKIDISLRDSMIFNVDGELLKGVSTFSVYTADTPIWVRYTGIIPQ